MGDLGKPGAFHATPPPSRQNKAGWKHSRKRSLQKRGKDFRATESTPSVELSEIQPTRSLSVERHSASPARPISDESIEGAERRSTLSPLSNEGISRGGSKRSGESDKITMPSAKVRLPRQSTPEVESMGDLWSEVASELVNRTSTSKIPTVASSQPVNISKPTKPAVPSVSARQPKAVRKTEQTTVTSSVDSFNAPDKRSSIPKSEVVYHAFICSGSMNHL